MTVTEIILAPLVIGAVICAALVVTPLIAVMMVMR